MIGAIAKAIEQLGDSRFRRVLLLGVGLTLALLFGVYALFIGALSWFIPDSFTLPWIGTITWVDEVISWASIPLMLVLSAFLMVPVASAFTSIFLDDVADAVEDRHFPHLSPAPRLTLIEGLADSIRFLGVLIIANIAALVLYLFFIPFAPLIFWGLNGFLLGREYFQLIAARRLGRDGARAMRRHHWMEIWLAGALMAIPLSVPILNLLVGMVGAAAFTHLFHRLAYRPSDS